MIGVKVLGDRVLIKPDVHDRAPEETDAGLYVAPTLAAAVTGADPVDSVCRGTVVAIGQPRHWLAEEALGLADKLSSTATRVAEPELFEDAAQLLKVLVHRDPIVCPGDDVIFSHDAGQELHVDDDRYIIVHEADVLAIITET